MIVSFTDLDTEGFATKGQSRFQGIRKDEALRLINTINAVTSEDDVPSLMSLRVHRMSMSSRKFMSADVGQGWKLKFRVWGRNVHDVQIIAADVFKGFDGAFSPRGKAYRIKALHPGIVLGKEMEARGLNLEDTSLLLTVDQSLIDDVVRRRSAVTADLAVRLSSASAEFWIDLQAQHDLEQVQNRHRKSPGAPLP